MKKIILFLSASILVLSCNQKRKFNSEEWKRFDWAPNGNTRLNMVDDLINSKRIIGKKPKEVIDILGEPQCCVGFDYNVRQSFSGIDVVESIYLEIHFNSDSVVTDVTLEKWEKN